VQEAERELLETALLVLEPMVGLVGLAVALVGLLLQVLVEAALAVQAQFLFTTKEKYK
jgi:hypothetical protein